MPSTLDWLRSRDDAALVALLRARPDLAVPAPTELSVLARRLDSPPSVWRAMERLDRFAIQLLQAVAVLRTKDKSQLPAAEIAAFLGADAPLDAVRAGLADLEAVGLVRGSDPVRPAPAVREALGEFPGGLGPRGRLVGPELQAVLDRVDPDGAALLRRLAGGQPRGSVPPGGSTRQLVAELVEAGLLLAAGPGAVLLPREVGLALRGAEPLGAVSVSPPAVSTSSPGVHAVDRAAGGEALAAIATVRKILEALGVHPAAALKSSGLGVRELRRVAKDAGVDELVAALHLELLGNLALIANSEPWLRGRTLPAWTPTPAADDFLAGEPEQQWATLAAAWLDLRRAPSRVGSKDLSGKAIAALSSDSTWSKGPADRRAVLQLFADLAPGAGMDQAAFDQRLAFAVPLWGAERQAGGRAVLTEARALGVIALDALPTASRLLLADDTGAALAAMRDCLPAPVAQILVQADLTIIAPGRLRSDLADRLALIADVESAGSATVYRVGPQSLRRGFDSGLSAAQIHELFAAHSTTAIPQALGYLIDDVGRRHGTLRLGRAGCYLRSDDPAQLDTALGFARSGGFDLRRLAPTVAVSDATIEDLLEVLRDAGLAPAAEDAGGRVVDLAPRPHRTKPPLYVPAAFARDPAGPSDEQLVALVHRMRSTDRHPEQDEMTPAQTMAALREAADRNAAVWIGYADSQGGTSRRIIEPVVVSGGTVAAFDRLRQSMRTFALHRVTGVAAVEPGRPESPVNEGRA